MSHKKSDYCSEIGIALGSGIARGWAHIGVIKRLVHAGFTPHIIAGSSIGAVVGASYATGHLAEIENFARTLTKSRIFSLLDIAFRGAGLLGGRKLNDELYKYMGGEKIENLQKIFIAVTTELATGHEIWLRKGSLVDALRASYALPGLFSPVHIDGRWLIDGALVNPVPSSVCRAWGARVVIAVNLNRDAFGKSSTSQAVFNENNEAQKNEINLKSSKPHDERPTRQKLLHQIFGSANQTPGMTTVLLAALNIMQDRLARSRLAGDPPDISISPKVGHISLLDFESADEAIALGEEATEKILPQLEEAVKRLC